MEKYGRLTAGFVKRQYISHLLLILLFVALSGGFVSFRGLEDAQAAKVMEMYVAFTGILLFTPLFMPEQDREIWDLERSKGTAMWQLYLPRILLAVLICILVISLFMGLMVRGGGSFDAGSLFLGACCEILFLGSIGFFASAVTNQVVVGYMIAVVYYAINIGGGKYLGKFALFQMMKGEYGSWGCWLLGAVVLLVSGVVVRERMRRRGWL